MGLRFAETQTEGGSFFKQGHIFVELKPELFERWRKGGGAGRGIKAAGEDKTAGRIEILSPDASIQNIRINPKETFSVSVEFVLSKDYSPRQGSPAQIDLIQLGAPGNPDKVVGGQRFTVDLSKLVLVKSGDQWRFWDNGMNPRTRVDVFGLRRFQMEARRSALGVRRQSGYDRRRRASRSPLHYDVFPPYVRRRRSELLSKRNPAIDARRRRQRLPERKGSLSR